MTKNLVFAAIFLCSCGHRSLTGVYSGIVAILVDGEMATGLLWTRLVLKQKGASVEADFGIEGLTAKMTASVNNDILERMTVTLDDCGPMEGMGSVDEEGVLTAEVVGKLTGCTDGSSDITLRIKAVRDAKTTDNK